MQEAKCHQVRVSPARHTDSSVANMLVTIFCSWELIFSTNSWQRYFGHLAFEKSVGRLVVANYLSADKLLATKSRYLYVGLYAFGSLFTPWSYLGRHVEARVQGKVCVQHSTKRTTQTCVDALHHISFVYVTTERRTTVVTWKLLGRICSLSLFKSSLYPN